MVLGAVVKRSSELFISALRLLVVATIGKGFQSSCSGSVSRMNIKVLATYGRLRLPLRRRRLLLS